MYSATDGPIMKHQDNRRGRWGVCVFSAINGSNPKVQTRPTTTCVTLTTYSTVLMCNIQTTERRMPCCLNVLNCERWNIYIYDDMCACLCVCVRMCWSTCIRVCVCVSGGPENDVWVYCSCAFLCFFRFTGVVAHWEAVFGGGLVCVRFPPLQRHFWGTPEQEEHPSKNSVGPRVRHKQLLLSRKKSSVRTPACPSLQTGLRWMCFLRRKKLVTVMFATTGTFLSEYGWFYLPGCVSLPFPRVLNKALFYIVQH